MPYFAAGKPANRNNSMVEGPNYGSKLRDELRIRNTVALSSDDLRNQLAVNIGQPHVPAIEQIR